MRAWGVAWVLACALGTGPARAGWDLVHEDDFARTGRIDPAVWQLETGWLRNREDQYYTPANAVVEGSLLRLVARPEAVRNAQHVPGSRDWRRARAASTYTSASLLSVQALQFGRVEVVARTPGGAGLWPALWLSHEGRGVYGEIDLFEAVGKHPDTVFAGVHWGTEPRTRQHQNDSRIVTGFEGSWHTHTLEWTPQAIVVSLDGQPWFRFDPEAARLPGGLDPLRLPMRLRINLALGGSWGGPIDAARLPASFDIASIRIWKWVPEDDPTATAKADEAPAPARVPKEMRWGR